jgi:serine protease Do
MTETNVPSRRGILPARRLTLLGSVAAIGAAMMLAPQGYDRLAGQALAATAQVQQGPAGFADLIAKVKPAVISVRVQVDQNAGANMPDNMPEMNGEEMPPFMKGTPFERFFHQRGFENGPQG